MDIKYPPKMQDEAAGRYLFVAIDRATRWVFMHIYADQSEFSSVPPGGATSRATRLRGNERYAGVMRRPNAK